MTKEFHFHGRAYVDGKASGRLLASNLELSFWGGVDPRTGEVIDRHHPLSGRNLQGAILAIPGGRGSCSGSGVLLELLLDSKGPAAMVFQRREDILTLGVMVAEEIFGKAIPVVTLEATDFCQLLEFDGRQVHVEGGDISSDKLLHVDLNQRQYLQPTTDHLTAPSGEITLSELDQQFVDGVYGEAARASMRIVIRMAALLGATELMDITQAHIDACIYTGPASLTVAEKLRDWGGRVRVPTSLNSISVDQRRWRAQGVDVELGTAASRLAEAFTDMGATPTFTCAPYQLGTAPGLGEQIAWAESNAVVYANSVLGARTMKYPDFLDIAIALTARAPKAGPHVESNRRATLVVRLLDIEGRGVDDSFYPLMGYHVGMMASSQIPLVLGMESLTPSNDDLKAFGAAFATVSSAPMFHIKGVTPEASSSHDVTGRDGSIRAIGVTLKDLASAWTSLNSDPLRHQQVDLVSLGNPHFSFSEIKKLAHLCRSRQKATGTSVMVTCGRATHGLAEQAGLVGELEAFGVHFITDTCWCMIGEPIVSPSVAAVVTNSGKYAHYGPGLTGKDFYLASLAGCVDAACGRCPRDLVPGWLERCMR